MTVDDKEVDGRAKAKLELFLDADSLYTIASIDTAVSTWNKAGEVIALAKASLEQSRTLAACASLLLCSALEQGVRIALSHDAGAVARKGDIELCRTPHATLVTGPLWRRVEGLPELLSGGCFGLDGDSLYVKALRNLVSIRNRLLHVDQLSKLLPGAHEQLKLSGDALFAAIPLPEDPWGAVTISMAESFSAAVDRYLKEVVIPDAGTIKEGMLVRRL